MDKINKLVQRALGNILNISYSVVEQKANKPVLEFDMIDECNVTASATATQYPTEYGQNVTDYKYASPDKVTLVGTIAIGGVLNAGFGPYGNVFTDSADRKTMVENIRSQCARLTSNMTLVGIQTRNSGFWGDMTMLSYEIDETVDNFNQLVVRMDFQRIMRFTSGGRRVANVADSPTQQSGFVQTQRV